MSKDLVKSKPTISVSEKSSPDQILYSSWLFLTSFQFFSIFQEYFQLSTFDIDTLESSLLASETSEWLEKVIIQITHPLLSNHRKQSLNSENYEKYLFDLFPEFGTSFQKLSIIDKIKLLKRIEEANLEHEEFLSWRTGADGRSLRLSSLGKDSDGWSYWHFGNRLYREIPLPNGKRAAKTLSDNQFTFELVSSTLEDWERLLVDLEQKKIKPRELCRTMTDIAQDTIAEIKEQMEANARRQAREEARLIREQKYDSIPKKRSRRLEAKLEEEYKRQRVEQQVILNQIEKENLQENKKKLKRAEDERYRIEDARLRNEISDFVKKYANTADDQEDRVEFKQLKNLLSSQASKEEKLIKMRGWLKLLREYENMPVSLIKDQDKYEVQGDDDGT